MPKLKFDLVTPDKLLFSDHIDMVIVPGKMGYLGILPEHSPLVASLKPGVIGIYKSDKRKECLYVKSGYAEITPHECKILVEEAKSLSQLDIEKLATTLKEMESDKEEATSPQAHELRTMLDVLKEANNLAPIQV